MLVDANVIALSALRAAPDQFSWFDFKPGVKKLILSGAPEAQHISLLWYHEARPGGVPPHRHDKTESIFVIEGAQSDPQGTYTRGSFCFNPPSSAHHVFDSAGLFLLSYAAPPNFEGTGDLASCASVKVDADYAALALSTCAEGCLCHRLPLDPAGGMSARFVRPPRQAITLRANMLLVLEGSCLIDGCALSADTLLVTKRSEPFSYQVSTQGEDCLLYQMAFE